MASEAALRASIPSAAASEALFMSAGAGAVPARPSPFDSEPVPVAFIGNASILYRAESLIPLKTT